MAQAFLHREEHILVAARLDMDNAARMQARKMQGRGKKVAPLQAPEHRPLHACQDRSKENGGAGVVGEFRASRNLMQGAGHYAARGQMPVDGVHLEWHGRMTSRRPLDSRYPRTQILDDDRWTHDRIMTRKWLICSLYVLISSGPVKLGCSGTSGAVREHPAISRVCRSKYLEER